MFFVVGFVFVLINTVRLSDNDNVKVQAILYHV